MPLREPSSTPGAELNAPLLYPGECVPTSIAVRTWKRKWGQRKRN
jgi:hypothetical protein